MYNHQETEYILNNPILMEQIEKFNQKQQKSSTQLKYSIDFDYILSNPDLIPQIRLLIETHKHHALSRIS